MLRAAVVAATEALMFPGDDQDVNYGRIRIWNSIFPDTRVNVSTDPVSLLHSVMKAYLRDRKSDKFCFQVAVLFLDLQDEFNRFVHHMPFSLGVAMRIAYNILYESIELSGHDQVKALIREVETSLPRCRADELKQILAMMAAGETDYDTYARIIKSVATEHVFDLFLAILPPRARLHLSFVHDRPPPEFLINFERLSMPLEFVQALCDTDGVDAVMKLLPQD